MFKDRFDAAEQLLPLLAEYKSKPDTIVIAIPRGGLELGNVLTKGLNLPLDVIFSKKLACQSIPNLPSAPSAINRCLLMIDLRMFLNCKSISHNRSKKFVPLSKSAMPCIERICRRSILPT